MSDYEDFIAALAGEKIDAELAAANPYSGFKAIPDSMSTLILKSSPGLKGKDMRSALKASLVSGLASGVLGSLSDNWATSRKQSYVDVLKNSILGKEAGRSENLSEALYQKAAEQGALLKLKSDLQKLQEEQELTRDVRKAGLIKAAEKMGELGAYGKGGSINKLMNPAEKEKTSIAEKLRAEIAGNETAKNYALIKPSLQAMQKYAQDDTLASDLPFVYELVKVLDPGSVVREGEISLAQGARSPLAKFQGTLSAIAGGSRMTPELKQELLSLAYAKGKALRNEYDAFVKPRLSIAESYGIDPSQLAVPVSPNEISLSPAKSDITTLIRDLHSQGYSRDEIKQELINRGING